VSLRVIPNLPDDCQTRVQPHLDGKACAGALRPQGRVLAQALVQVERR